MQYESLLIKNYSSSLSAFFFFFGGSAKSLRFARIYWLDLLLLLHQLHAHDHENHEVVVMADDSYTAYESGRRVNCERLRLVAPAEASPTAYESSADDEAMTDAYDSSSWPMSRRPWASRCNGRRIVHGL